MTYIVGSVGVEIDQRAVRPREPARPLPSKALASPEMATRQARPRATVPASSVTAKLIAQVTKLKGQQAKLEKLLKALGDQLKVCRGITRNPGMLKNHPAKVQAARMECIALEKAIMACINAIKACAGKANEAAAAAIATGASDAQVKQAAVVAAPSSGKEAVVEVSTAAVTPSGQIVPGPGAAVVTTPVLTEAVAPGTPPGTEVAPDDSAVVTEEAAESAGKGIPTWALIGGAALVGYMVFRKK